MSALLELILSVGLFLGLIALGFFAGRWTESRHYRSIRRRERELQRILVFAVRTPPEAFLPCRSCFVSGSVVVGMDYFKMFAAKLRNLVGGRVGSYETLIDRARREAVLRMKEEAAENNAACILNVKFSTANIYSGDSGNKGFGCVEVIAYGTALVPGE